MRSMCQPTTSGRLCTTKSSLLGTKHHHLNPLWCDATQARSVPDTRSIVRGRILCRAAIRFSVGWLTLPTIVLQAKMSAGMLLIHVRKHALSSDFHVFFG